MGFLSFIKTIGDIATDFIPGGDAIDSFLGLDQSVRASDPTPLDQQIRRAESAERTRSIVTAGLGRLGAPQDQRYRTPEEIRREERNMPDLVQTTPRSAGGGDYYNSPWVPDFIENIYNPPPVATNGAASGAMTRAMGGCNITVAMQTRSVASCPPGYVAVDTNGDGVSDVCMLKEVARACKLWRPRPKPVMTASDRRALNAASRVMRKVDTVVKQTNQLRGAPKLTKSRPSRR